MDVHDLEVLRSVLSERRSAIDGELVTLDAAISRLDKLIEGEDTTTTWHRKFQALRAVKDSAS